MAMKKKDTLKKATLISSLTLAVASLILMSGCTTQHRQTATAYEVAGAPGASGTKAGGIFPGGNVPLSSD